MEPSTNPTRKKEISQIGFRYAIFAAVVTAFKLIAFAALKTFAPELTEQHETTIRFLLVIVSTDIIGFPLVWGLTRKLPSTALPRQNLGAKNFFLGILFCEGICGAGTIIGSIVHIGLSTLLGGDGASNNLLSTLMLNSDPFIRILTVGILAPVFEELITRKLLIDHLVKYGKGLAIAASGILFGLFHGNFSQFFFATGLGFFFAYIYIKTGKIHYTIAYHMIINLSSAVITTPLAGKYLEILEEVGMERLMEGSPEVIVKALPVMLLYLGWVGILGIVDLVGFILLCVNLKRFRLQEEAGNPPFGKAIIEIVTNPGMLAFVAVCMVIFIKTYFFA